MFGSKKAARPAAPSVATLQHGHGRMIIQVTGVTLADYRGTENLNALDHLTRDIVLSARAHGATDVTITDGKIMAFSSTSMSGFPNSVHEILDLPIAVPARRTRPMGSARQR